MEYRIVDCDGRYIEDVVYLNRNEAESARVAKISKFETENKIIHAGFWIEAKN
jgi:hypothetical protein